MISSPPPKIDINDSFMGKYVNNGIVTLNGSVDYDDAVREIATLVGVGRRDDGRYYLADVCIAEGINKWARHKPLIYNVPLINKNDPTLAVPHAAGTDGAGRVGGLVVSTTKATASNLYALIVAQSFVVLDYAKPVGSYYKRLKDFNGYIHTADYGNTANAPFRMSIANTDLQIGGSISMNITLGATDDYKLLQPSEIMGIFGGYFGLLILRNNGNTGLNNSYQYAGSDWFVITTQKKLLQYDEGVMNQPDTNGLVSVSRLGPYIFDIQFKIPAKADLTNTAAGFDEFVGKTISVYPIATNGHIAYLEEGSASIDVTKFALNNSAWKPASFQIQAADYDALYVAPTFSLDFTLSKNVSAGVIILEQFVLTIAAKHQYAAVYDVNVTGISYTVEYLAGYESDGSEVWQPDGGNSGGTITWGEATTLGMNQTKTLYQTSGGGWQPYHKGVTLKVTAYAYGTATYSGKTHTVTGLKTSKTIVY